MWKELVPENNRRNGHSTSEHYSLRLTSQPWAWDRMIRSDRRFHANADAGIETVDKRNSVVRLIFNWALWVWNAWNGPNKGTAELPSWARVTCVFFHICVDYFSQGVFLLFLLLKHLTVSAHKIKTVTTESSPSTTVKKSNLVGAGE